MRAKINLRYLQVNISEKHLTARGREAPAVCDTHASVQYLRLKVYSARAEDAREDM